MGNAIRFIYFDLGNVLLWFDPQMACRRMAEVAGVDEHAVRRIVYESFLAKTYEKGLITSREFYLTFCQLLNCRPDFEQLLHASADMFTVNQSAWELARRLRQAGHRLGILSNTCEAHWNYCCRYYGSKLTLFDVHALSFRLQAMKPDERIYVRAAELAGVQPTEVFFTDDRGENVEAARSCGYDAVVFQNVEQLEAELYGRGLLSPTLGPLE